MAVLTKEEVPVAAEFHFTVYASLGNHRCRIYSAWCSHGCWDIYPLSTGNKDSWWQDVGKCHFTSWVKGGTQYNLWLTELCTSFTAWCLLICQLWVSVWYLLLHSSWIKRDQRDITCFIISLFTAQHVSNVSTSILRSLRLNMDLFHVLYCSGSMCVGVTVWFGWGGAIQHMK